MYRSRETAASPRTTNAVKSADVQSTATSSCSKSIKAAALHPADWPSSYNKVRTWLASREHAQEKQIFTESENFAILTHLIIPPHQMHAETGVCVYQIQSTVYNFIVLSQDL